MDRETPPLDSLFQELILEHYKRPRNKGELPDADTSVHMKNPTCGDEVRLQLRLRDGVIDEACFGRGPPHLRHGRSLDSGAQCGA